MELWQFGVVKSQNYEEAKVKLRGKLQVDVCRPWRPTSGPTRVQRPAAFSRRHVCVWYNPKTLPEAGVTLSGAPFESSLCQQVVKVTL